MQVIIIGNGFDLASGLPTKYENYFDDFIESNRTVFSNLGKIIYNDDKEISPSIEESMSLSYMDFIKSSSIIEELIDKNISIWNLFFWFTGIDENKNYDWSSIEAQIATILDFEEESSPLYFPDNLQMLNLESLNIKQRIKLNKQEDNEKTTPQEKNKMVVGGFRTYDRLKIIVVELLNNKYQKTSITNKFQVFKSELNLLEESFKNYISNVYEDKVLNRSGSLAYRDNLSKLIDPLIKDCYILNFNYTDLSLKTTSSNFSFQKNNIEYNVLQNNVHGVYYDKIIFGIDQKEISTTNPKYAFSKTYRKLETIFKNGSIGLPPKSKVKLISFYGHSFSKADYSYFRSIFDYYDLYNSSIKLKFYYSNFAKSDLARSDVTSLIFNLLESYAESMYSGNKHMEKNLLHKLILEDRIKVEEIDLKKII